MSTCGSQRLSAMSFDGGWMGPMWLDSRRGFVDMRMAQRLAHPRIVWMWLFDFAERSQVGEVRCDQGWQDPALSDAPVCMLIDEFSITSSPWFSIINMDLP